MRRVALIGVVAGCVAAIAWSVLRVPNESTSRSAGDAVSTMAVPEQPARTQTPVESLGAQDNTHRLPIESAASEPNAGSIAGELTVPTSWQTSDAQMVALSCRQSDLASGVEQQHAIHQATRLARSKDSLFFTFQIDELPPGEYEIWCVTPPVSGRATVESGRTSKISLAAPYPVNVVVRPVDATTRRRVPFDRTEARAVRGDGSLSPFFTRSETADPSRVLCIPGLTRFSTTGRNADYGNGTVDAVVSATGQVVEVPLTPYARVRLRISSQGRPFPVPLGQLTIQGEDGEEPAYGVSKISAIDGPIIHIPNAGRYVVGFREAIPGFNLPVKQTIEVIAGATADVAFDLVPR